MLISASAVMTMTTNRRSSRSGSNGSGMPAISEPSRHQHAPARKALIVPERLKPAISSSLRDRRDQVALVQPARLVVDEDDAAADHDHHEDGHRDRAGQQVLDVRHVRVELDDVEPPLRGDPRRPCVGSLNAATTLFIDAASEAKTKLSVLSEIRASRGALPCSDAAREARRNRQDAVDAAVAQIVRAPRPVRVVHGVERVRVRRDGRRQLADADRRHAVVLIDDGEFRCLTLPPNA